MIRLITEKDAQKYYDFWQNLVNETTFMLMNPDDLNITVEEHKIHIQNLLSKDNHTIFVKEKNDQLIGCVIVRGGELKKNRHSAYVVIGILQKYVGQGLGKQLFIRSEEWAKQHQIHRLELTVMTHNQRAIALYEKMGFFKEGTKKDSLVLNGEYIDEFFMAKLL